MNLKKEIEKLIKSEIENLGYSLVKIKTRRQKRGLFLTIVINKVGGVSVEDCAKVSRLIEPILDKKDLIQERYFLIVSSPGIK